MGVIISMRVFFLCLLAFLFILSGVGCGVLSGKKHSYSNACGPIAIHNASKDLHIDADVISISEEIEKEGSTCVKGLLSIFDNRATLITFPWEIERFFIKRGYKIINIRNINELDKDKDVAIVLVQERSSWTYHWIAFPYSSKFRIKNFFGDETNIHEIFIIKKR